MGASASKAPRDPTAFTQLLPGVTGFSATSNTAGNVYGSQSASQEVYVEGMPLTVADLQGETRTVFLAMSVEAVDQFQLETAGTAVMYSGEGSTNFVLKSGTNQFHGDAYEYLRNTLLDARGFFAALRPAEHQNEFGFNVNGPIRKNRIFFFGNYDGYRYNAGSPPVLESIPTVAQRTGDFSALPVAIYDPQTTNCTVSPCTRQVFPGNIVPASRISPIAQYLQSFLPAPTNSGLLTNYLDTNPFVYHNNSTTEKVDMNLSDKHRLTVVFSRGHRGQGTPYRTASNLPEPYAYTRYVDEVPTSSQIRETWVITPNLLNQVGFSASRLWVPITSGTTAGNFPTKAGLTGLPSGEASEAFPPITFSGPNAPVNWATTNTHAYNEALNNYTWQDNLQWVHGRHAFTFGFQMQRLEANEKTDATGSLATWTFSNTQTAGFGPTGTLLTTTGNAYASYLLGGVNSANVTQDSVIGTGGRYHEYAWWVQDNYKLTPRLTLNLGLRYDIMTPYVEAFNRMSFFNPTAPNPAAGGYPGILEFAGSGADSCNCQTPVKTHYGNLGPRLGLAYAISNKTVVRAGYSVMYSRRGAVGGTTTGGQTGTGLLGYSASPSFTSPDGGISPAFYWGNGVPAYQAAPFFVPTLNTGYTTTVPQGSSINYGDPDIGGRPPRYLNWNVGLMREVVPTVTLGVTYVGSDGHFLSGAPRGMWSSQINPAYLALGNLLLSSATPANLASAKAIVPGIALPYSNFSGSIAQMLLPFPQYSSVTDLWGNVGNSTYNSLQVTAQKTMSHGLSASLNYVWAKGFDDLSYRSGYFVDRAPTATIPDHVLHAMFAYRLPFGKGQQWLAGNRAVEAIVSGWNVSGITTYQAGAGIGTIAAACNLPSAGSCYASYNPNFSGPVRINGSWGSGNLSGSVTPSFIAVGAFVSPAAYTYGNTPRTMAFGLRGPGLYDQDISLRREFRYHEHWRLAFEADAFNVANWTCFSNPATNITSSNFGKITAQSNTPRVVQFAAKLSF